MDGFYCGINVNVQWLFLPPISGVGKYGLLTFYLNFTQEKYKQKKSPTLGDFWNFFSRITYTTARRLRVEVAGPKKGRRIFTAFFWVFLEKGNNSNHEPFQRITYKKIFFSKNRQPTGYSGRNCATHSGETVPIFKELVS